VLIVLIFYHLSSIIGFNLHKKIDFLIELIFRVESNPIYNPMKLKLQVKSARVKCLVFHPSKPWVIASLYSGEIQIWDYNMQAPIAHY